MKRINFLYSLIYCFSIIFLFFISSCSKYSDEVQANLTRLKTTKSCPGCDLRRIELISFDLKNADLSGANLTDANLRSSDLTGANLTDTNLTNTDLFGVNLTGAKLINTNLTGVKLSYANTNGVEMSNNTRGSKIE